MLQLGFPWVFSPVTGGFLEGAPWKVNGWLNLQLVHPFGKENDLNQNLHEEMCKMSILRGVSGD